MQLKKYQQDAIDKLSSYLMELKKFGPKHAFISTVGTAYNDDFFGEVPFVCIKIPTGGGKTLVATHAVAKILDTILNTKMDKGIVMWFVPSEAIKSQTLRKLNNKNDWHRQVLDEYFDNKVKIFSNEEALRIQKQDVEGNNCIIVSSLDAFRKEKKLRDKYKVYQENGELLQFFENSESDPILEKDESGTITNSLANVIKMHNPLIVIDEGHRSGTELSISFLKDLNPSFVIEFTATPKEKSNILVNTHSSELKEEKMVKIPIILESVSQWQTAVSRGVLRRKELEASVKKEKNEYIRPIALIQAEQEIESDKKVTVGQVKDFLRSELHIPEEEIAIKTSKSNEIKDIDLFSKKCPIRYIITVNALAEGWDCSFAYVLISVSNIGARMSVEQIIGRIMRLPYAREKKQEDLNYSYVFASTRNFNEAANQVVSSLEKNGYTRGDVIGAGSEKTKYEFEVERATDLKVKIPTFYYENDALAFGDLIGEEFEIAKHNHEFEFVTHYDNDGRIKLDINDEDKWIKERQTTLNLAYKDKNFSEKELIQWLDKKIRIQELKKEDKVAFIEKVIKYQLKKYTLSELSVNRFVLRDKIDEEINNQMEEYAKKRFQKLEKEKKIHLTPIEYYPEKITIAEKVPEKFKKHLYKEVGKLNKEELNFTSRLDSETLPNIKCWVRNREKKDFYVQGWKRNKFYPDFIALTNGGSILAIEWKGGDRVSNADTQYKIKIAEDWERLSGNKAKFFLVNTANIEEKLREIKEIK